MHNAHRYSWAQRQKEVKKILKQRSQEWKEKQSLYQLMRSAASQNSLLGYRNRGNDPVLSARGRGNHPTGTEIIPRTAYNWYPGFVNPTDATHVRSYPVPGYPIMSEYDPKFTANPGQIFKRRLSNEVSSSDVEKLGCAGHTIGGHHEPIIKEVVSLAHPTSPNNDEENTADHRRRKRVRKSIGMYNEYGTHYYSGVWNNLTKDLGQKPQPLQNKAARITVGLMLKIDIFMQQLKHLSTKRQIISPPKLFIYLANS